MAFEPTLPEIVRTGTGVLWLGLGVALLATRRHITYARWLGIFLLAFAPELIAVNVAQMEVPVDGGHLVIVEGFTSLTDIFAIAALCLLLRDESRSGHASARRALVGGSIAVAITLVGFAAYARLTLQRDNSSFSYPVRVADIAHGGLVVVVVTMLAAVGAHFAMRARTDEPDAAGFVWLAAGLAVFPFVYARGIADTSEVQLALAGHLALLVEGFAAMAPTLIVLILLYGSPQAAGKLPAVTLFAVGVVAIVAGSLSERDFGERGIARAIAFALIAYAFLRHLGASTSAARGNRTAAITGALAALFIVAQVAQNFLSAQYGLLMGGVVAGALLFAAQPIQRAIEGRAPGPAPGPADGRKEEAYRKALRFALRDGHVSREEELHLHEIAQVLGIPGRRAHELLIETERERGAG